MIWAVVTGTVGLLKPNIIDGLFQVGDCVKFMIWIHLNVFVYFIRARKHTHTHMKNEHGIDVLSTSVWSQSYSWCLTCSNVQTFMSRSLPETFLAVATRHAAALAVKGPPGLRDGDTKLTSCRVLHVLNLVCTNDNEKSPWFAASSCSNRMNLANWRSHYHISATIDRKWSIWSSVGCGA